MKPDIFDLLRSNSIPITESGCRIWLRSTRGGGYAQITYNGRQTEAHRVVWELTHGPIPDGLFVCHTCDIRSCIEETHLFLGTNQDNMSDAKKKGRLTRTDNHKKKISLAMTGKRNAAGCMRSPEHRAAIRAAQLGNTNGVGHARTLEHREKISAAKRAWWAAQKGLMLNG